MKEPYRYGVGALICKESQDNIEEIAAHPELAKMYNQLPANVQQNLAMGIEENIAIPANREFKARTGIAGRMIGSTKIALEIYARQQLGDLRALPKETA